MQTIPWRKLPDSPIPEYWSINPEDRKQGDSYYITAYTRDGWTTYFVTLEPPLPNTNNPYIINSNRLTAPNGRQTLDTLEAAQALAEVHKHHNP